MSALDDVIKDINKKYKETIIGKSDVKQRNYEKVPFATPDFSAISEMEVLLIPFDVKSANAESKRESRFFFLLVSNLLILSYLSQSNIIFWSSFNYFLF